MTYHVVSVLAVKNGHTLVKSYIFNPKNHSQTFRFILARKQACEFWSIDINTPTQVFDEYLEVEKV